MKAFQINKNIISIIIAVSLGVLAVVLVNVYLAKERTRLEMAKQMELGQQVPVVVARVDILRGTKISEGMLEVVGVHESALQPRIMQDPGAAIGKVTIADIVAGEQVSSTKLMSGGTARSYDPGFSAGPVGSGGLAMRIPSGKRAFTLALDAVSAGGGLLKPNDYVDVMGTFPFTQNIEGQPMTQNVSVTLFQNILVLAVGGTIVGSTAEEGAARGVSNTVTFALTPQQVELLNFAQGMGNIRLVLRPPLETGIQSLAPVTADVLWQQILEQAGMTASKPNAQEAEVVQTTTDGYKVEIYRGQSKEVRTIE